MPRKKRSDAIANRERLLEAAFELLDERDPNLSVRELAVHTGLGIGTAYRHFPTHDDLIRALYDRAVEQSALGLAGPVEATTPFAIIAELLERFVMITASMPSVRTIQRLMYDLDPSYRPGKFAIEPIEALIEAAVADGSLRSGVTMGDLATFSFALGGMVGRPTEPEQNMLRRSIAIFLDGLRADAATTELPGPALDADDFHVFTHRSLAPARAALDESAAS